MIGQVFKIGDRVSTFSALNEGDETIWIVDKVELRVRLGEEPHIVYGIRKLNSYDDDPNGSCGFYFGEDELVGIESEYKD